MNSYSNSALKRLGDISFSLVVLPFALFLVVLGAIAILATQGSKVLFTQKRVGRDGKEFVMYKLRTLKLNAKDDLSGMRKNDPDIIWVGWVLRAWRIDELPQIFNILKGDMSWVGPRPERPHIVAKCIEEIPNYGKRHVVLPGITGWAQIHHPDATPNDNLLKLPYDLEYVEKAGFKFDALIIWKTLVAIG
jgi:lipopolysaccharide/colanic/teichoic acid biosynthesis glycosyltransferase